MSKDSAASGIKKWIGVGGAGIAALFARFGCHAAEDAVKLAKPAIFQAAEHSGALTEGAAKAAVHGAGTLGEDAAKAAGHSVLSVGKGAGEHAAASAAEHVGEKGAKGGLGLVKTGAKRTGDAENIARNAANVARGELRRRIRNSHRDESDRDRAKHAKPAPKP